MTTAKPPAIRTRPLTLHAREVRGLLDGTITQLRRPVTWAASDHGLSRDTLHDLDNATADPGFPDPADGGFRRGYLHVPVAHPDDGWDHVRSHRVYCRDRPGDMIWCREAWTSGAVVHRGDGTCFVYKADGEWAGRTLACRWRSPATMPRHASRLTLEVLAVHPQRADKITDADGIACGARHFPDIPLDPWHRPDTMDRWSMKDPETTGNCMSSPRLALANWWNYTYGAKDGWTSKEWVWVRTVKVVRPEATR